MFPYGNGQRRFVQQQAILGLLFWFIGVLEFIHLLAQDFGSDLRNIDESQKLNWGILPYIPDMDSGTLNSEFLTSVVFFKRSF